jgi:transmembrane sensor
MNTEIAESNVSVSEQAAAWFVELSDGPNNRATRQRFVRWLKRSPQHIDSFLAMAILDQELSNRPDGIEDALAVIDRPGPRAIPIDGGTVDQANADRKPKRGPQSSGWLAAAAITAVAVLGSLPFLLPPDAPPTFVHRTDFGEQRSIALSDGSIVVLNTVSEIAVHYDTDARRVELLSGEALFDVASDPQRPFVVETGTVALKALGTRFSVYHTPETTRLAVVEGVVRAVSRQQPEQEVLVQAGEGAVAMADGAIHRKDEIDVDKAIAWTERRLIFEKAPLADVVSEFNRYNRQPLIVQDPQLAERRITSVFYANDVSALVAFLELEPDVEVNYGTDAIRIRRKH